MKVKLSKRNIKLLGTSLVALIIFFGISWVLVPITQSSSVVTQQIARINESTQNYDNVLEEYQNTKNRVREITSIGDATEILFPSSFRTVNIDNMIIEAVARVQGGNAAWTPDNTWAIANEFSASIGKEFEWTVQGISGNDFNLEGIATTYEEAKTAIETELTLLYQEESVDVPSEFNWTEELSTEIGTITVPSINVYATLTPKFNWNVILEGEFTPNREFPDGSSLYSLTGTSSSLAAAKRAAESTIAAAKPFIAKGLADSRVLTFVSSNYRDKRVVGVGSADINPVGDEFARITPSGAPTENGQNFLIKTAEEAESIDNNLIRQVDVARDCKISSSKTDPTTFQVTVTDCSSGQVKIELAENAITLVSGGTGPIVPIRSITTGRLFSVPVELQFSGNIVSFTKLLDELSLSSPALTITDFEIITTVDKRTNTTNTVMNVYAYTYYSNKIVPIEDRILPSGEVAGDTSVTATPTE